MKSMTCKQLGGACDQVFFAESFDEIAALSRRHGMEMFEKGDEAHLKAMQEMKVMMKSSAGLEAWYEAKKKEFESSPSVSAD